MALGFGSKFPSNYFLFASKRKNFQNGVFTLFMEFENFCDLDIWIEMDENMMKLDGNEWKFKIFEIVWKWRKCDENRQKCFGKFVEIRWKWINVKYVKIYGNVEMVEQ